MTVLLPDDVHVTLEALQTSWTGQAMAYHGGRLPSPSDDPAVPDIFLDMTLDVFQHMYHQSEI